MERSSSDRILGAVLEVVRSKQRERRAAAHALERPGATPAQTLARLAAFNRALAEECAVSAAMNAALAAAEVR